MRLLSERIRHAAPSLELLEDRCVLSPTASAPATALAPISQAEGVTYLNQLYENMARVGTAAAANTPGTPFNNVSSAPATSQQTTIAPFTVQNVASINLTQSLQNLTQYVDGSANSAGYYGGAQVAHSSGTVEEQSAISALLRPATRSVAYWLSVLGSPNQNEITPAMLQTSTPVTPISDATAVPPVPD